MDKVVIIYTCNKCHNRVWEVGVHGTPPTCCNKHMSCVSNLSEEDIVQHAIDTVADVVRHIGDPITDETIKALTQDYRRTLEECGFEVLDIEAVPQKEHPHAVDLLVTLKHSTDGPLSFTETL